jgi:hypothetical protein
MLNLTPDKHKPKKEEPSCMFNSYISKTQKSKAFFLPTHAGALSTTHSEADIKKLFSETERYTRCCKAT